MKKLLLILTSCIVLTGCRSGTPNAAVVEKVVKRDGQPQIDYVANDDRAMNAAIAKARATVGSFATAVNAPKPQQNSFAVKKKFTDQNASEHMWINSLRFDGKVFRGQLSNNPYEVKTVKLGDIVIVDPKEVSDWMYIDKGKLIGGYTIRVVTDKMSPSEKEAFEREGGYKLD